MAGLPLAGVLVILGLTPVAAPAAPLAATPVIATPVIATPVIATPLAQAPLAQAPLAQAPLAQAPLAQAPLTRVPLGQAAPGQAPLAQTAPAAPPKPTTLQITSADLHNSKIILQAKTQPQLFTIMLSEVSWLATATPQTSAPPTRSLGPKYTVTVLVKNSPQQVYDLFPLAIGGPRAHRPARQPGGRKKDGWFFGRLTMSESLRLSGAPLAVKRDVVTGGIGGGSGVDAVADATPPLTMQQALAQLRQLVLLNVAVLIIILAGLGGIAYLIRRRV